MTRLLAVLAVGLGLAGCTPISQFMALGDRVEAVTEPNALYVLTPKSTFDPGLPEVRRQIVIEEPIASSHLDTDRIAVKPGPYQVEYFPAVRWADRAPLLVRRLLVESFENTGKVASVSGQRIGLASDFLLFTDLREFQAATTSEAGDAVLVNVQLNLKIVDEVSGLIIASARRNRPGRGPGSAVGRRRLRRGAGRRAEGQRRVGGAHDLRVDARGRPAAARRRDAAAAAADDRRGAAAYGLRTRGAPPAGVPVRLGETTTMTELPRGLIAPNLTPFNDDLSVATDLYVAHAERLLADGCAGLAPFGTTGEALSVGVDERIDALGALIASGVPADRLVPGTGLTNLPETIRLSRACLELGCAGVMVLPPFYFKGVSDDGLHAYFAALVAALGDGARICLYHIPAVSGVGLPVPLVARLVEDFPGIVAIKDSSGETENLAQLLDVPGLAVYPGTELLAPQGIAGGAAGCISATANVNAPMLAEFLAALTEVPAGGFGGEEVEALEARVRAVRLALQAAGPIPAQKRLMALATGEARWANVRPPLMPMPEQDGRYLAEELAPYLELGLPA